MTKQEFLQQQTRDMIEVVEKYGTFAPSFAILYDDGTFDSFATHFDGPLSKKNFEYIMRKMCMNPKVTTCIFTSMGWQSRIADKINKAPSQCEDKEEILMLSYSTRNGEKELHIFKLDKNNKLKRSYFSDKHEGRFTNPFLNPCLTLPEKVILIDKFQKSVRESICSAYEKLHQMAHMLFILSDTKEQVSVHQISGSEWADQKSFKEMLLSKGRELQTVAILLTIQENNDNVKVILISDVSKKLFSYSINHESSILEFEEEKAYDGEYSNLINKAEIDSIIKGDDYIAIPL